MFDSNIKYHVFKDYNINIDETANGFVSVRLAQWLKGDKEPDESKAKYEIRKIIVNPDGEQPMKGVSLSSPKAVGDLAIGLLDAGFGDTRPVLLTLAKRPDFKATVENIDKDPDDEGSGELFDMRSLLLGIDEGE